LRGKCLWPARGPACPSPSRRTRRMRRGLNAGGDEGRSRFPFPRECSKHSIEFPCARRPVPGWPNFATECASRRFPSASRLRWRCCSSRAAPRADDVPVPIADAHALAHSAEIDHDLAERARRETLPGAVRGLGSAMRAYHTLEAALDGADPSRLVAARRAIDVALTEARGPGEVRDEAMLRLRALELEGFI